MRVAGHVDQIASVFAGVLAIEAIESLFQIGKVVVQALRIAPVAESASMPEYLTHTTANI